MDAGSSIARAPEDTGALLPVLQIVHVTDLHVKDTASNAISVLSRKARLLARFARKLQAEGLFGWEEGTQGHLARAPEAFRRFLADWRADHPAWREVPVWLLDTGDRTAFGDPESIELGGRMLAAWSEALGGCPIRTLFGNHDMWPRTLPLLNGPDVSAQRARIHAVPGWDTPRWRTEPLSVPIPGHAASIDLYALDTVVSGAVLGVLQNTLAVGEIPGEDLLHLRMLLEGHKRRGRSGLRILALHHPVAFPWLKEEVRTYGGLPTMRLLDDREVASRLNNDLGIPEGIGPWAHLLLSGHTHMSHPAAGLSGDVASFAQRPLGAYQVQLVGSSLMLNRPSHAGGPGEVRVQERELPGYSSPRVFPHPCLAQILRFLASPDPGQPWIQMIRTPVYSNDDGRHYVPGAPDALLLHYRLPEIGKLSHR